MEVLGFFILDYRYFLFVGPAILIGLWAQARVKSAYANGNRYAASSGMSGAEAAARILEVHGITTVGIEPVNSFLGDHYDPKSKMLRLSPDVYNGRTLSALGIAAHEVGHAIQDKVAYAPLAIRNGLVPMASIGSNLSIFLVFAGLVLSSMVASAAHLGQMIAVAGLGLFAIVVVFQLVNLPVEFNASTRAREVLLNQRMITDDEDRIVAKVLDAAAMTYVAATITAIATLLYYAMLVFGRRD